MQGYNYNRYKTYSDGVTYIIDAFWNNVCQDCRHVYLSCTCDCKCPKCGSEKIVRTLEGKSLEEVIAERRPDLIQSKSE